MLASFQRSAVSGQLLVGCSDLTKKCRDLTGRVRAQKDPRRRRGWNSRGQLSFAPARLRLKMEGLVEERSDLEGSVARTRARCAVSGEASLKNATGWGEIFGKLRQQGLSSFRLRGRFNSALQNTRGWCARSKACRI